MKTFLINTSDTKDKAQLIAFERMEVNHFSKNILNGWKKVVLQMHN